LQSERIVEREREHRGKRRVVCGGRKRRKLAKSGEGGGRERERERRVSDASDKEI